MIPRHTLQSSYSDTCSETAVVPLSMRHTPLESICVRLFTVSAWSRAFRWLCLRKVFLENIPVCIIWLQCVLSGCSVYYLVQPFGKWTAEEKGGQWGKHDGLAVTFCTVHTKTSPSGAGRYTGGYLSALCCADVSLAHTIRSAATLPGSVGSNPLIP